MGPLTGFVVADILVALSTVLYLLFWYYTSNFNYWKNRGVPFIKPHWFFGNMGHQVFQRKTCADFAINLYNKFKGNGYGGIFIFRKPALVLCDQTLVEKVLTQDFAHFQDRSVACNPDEALSSTLMNASGDKWRKIRHNLTPTFSSTKVKGMFDQIYKCGDNILRDIDKCAEKNETINIEPLAFVFSTEVIASCAFGVQLMTDSTEGKRFRKAVDLVFETTPWRLMKMFFAIMEPKLCHFLGITLIQKPVADFFMNLTKETIKYRERSKINRNDFLQMMLTLKAEEESIKDITWNSSNENNTILNQHHSVTKGLKERCFTENTIASLVFNFLSAGIKPATATITFTLHELAKNPSIQQKLQEEVDVCFAKHGRFSYQAVKEMIYLDQIIQEIHRLYTTQKVLSRLVTDTYKLPNTDLTLEKGVVVYIPIAAIHKDPELYPSPEEFNPDRFAGNNFKPSFAFMPYGNGPRICIGIRFAVLMMKVFVARIVAKYMVRSEMELPIRWDKKMFCPEPKGGVLLSFHKRGQQS